MLVGVLWQTEESGTGPGAPEWLPAAAAAAQAAHFLVTSTTRAAAAGGWDSSHMSSKPTKAHALNTSPLAAPSKVFALYAQMTTETGQHWTTGFMLLAHQLEVDLQPIHMSWKTTPSPPQLKRPHPVSSCHPPLDCWMNAGLASG